MFIRLRGRKLSIGYRWWFGHFTYQSKRGSFNSCSLDKEPVRILSGGYVQGLEFLILANLGLGKLWWRLYSGNVSEAVYWISGIFPKRVLSVAVKSFKHRLGNWCSIRLWVDGTFSSVCMTINLTTCFGLIAASQQFPYKEEKKNGK